MSFVQISQLENQLASTDDALRRERGLCERLQMDLNALDKAYNKLKQERDVCSTLLLCSQVGLSYVNVAHSLSPFLDCRAWRVLPNHDNTAFP